MKRPSQATHLLPPVALNYRKCDGMVIVNKIIFDRVEQATENLFLLTLPPGSSSKTCFGKCFYL